jgi:hypothetical protein
MPDVVRCPECDAALRLKEPRAKIRCPRCEHVFSPAGEDDEDERPARTTARSPARRPADDRDEDEPRRASPRRPRRDDDDDDDEPRDRPRPKKKRKSSNAGLVVGIVVGALLLLGGAGVGAYFLFFKDADKKEKKDKDEGSAADTKDRDGAGPRDGGQAQGGLTAENFQKVTTLMSDAEVVLILGPPSSTQDKQVPVGGPTGKPIPVREAVWEKKDAAQPTRVVCTFSDGIMIEGSGKIDGKSVTARRGVSRVSRASFNKIQGKFDWTKPQIEEILGRPTKSLGPQQVTAGVSSAETYLYTDGVNRILIHWYANGQFGGIEMNSGR